MILYFQKKSGLLSVLQSPVSELDSTSSQGSSTTTLILPAKLLPTAVRNVGTKKEKTKNPNLNNESDDEDIDADFFSLYKVDTVEDLPEPIDIDFSIEMNSISNDLKPERPIQLNKLTGKVIENEIIISKSIDSYHIDGSVNDMETENQVDLDEDAVSMALIKLHLVFSHLDIFLCINCFIYFVASSYFYSRSKNYVAVNVKDSLLMKLK